MHVCVWYFPQVQFIEHNLYWKQNIPLNTYIATVESIYVFNRPVYFTISLAPACIANCPWLGLINYCSEDWAMMLA